MLCCILQNLVENSIKYRKFNYPEQSAIWISARLQRDKVVINIKDNGQGMSAAVINRAFDMFYRGNEGSKGSGLGLFIVKSNIEKLKGQVKIKSKLYIGTDIMITLPLSL